MGALYTPGTTVLTPTEATSGRRLPLHSGQSLHPAALPIDGARLTRHQRGFTQFARPVFPSPVAARMERAALGLSPGLRTPPTRSRTTHARVGTGHRARTWNYTLNSSVDLQSGSSLVVCDLGSHVAKPVAGGSDSGRQCDGARHARFCRVRRLGCWDVARGSRGGAPDGPLCCQVITRPLRGGTRSPLVLRRRPGGDRGAPSVVDRRSPRS